MIFLKLFFKNEQKIFYIQCGVVVFDPLLVDVVMAGMFFDKMPKLFFLNSIVAS